MTVNTPRCIPTIPPLTPTNAALSSPTVASGVSRTSRRVRRKPSTSTSAGGRRYRAQIRECVTDGRSEIALQQYTLEHAEWNRSRLSARIGRDNGNDTGGRSLGHHERRGAARRRDQHRRHAGDGHAQVLRAEADARNRDFVSGTPGLWRDRGDPTRPAVRVPPPRRPLA